MSDLSIENRKREENNFHYLANVSIEKFCDVLNECINDGIPSYFAVIISNSHTYMVGYTINEENNIVYIIQQLGVQQYLFENNSDFINNINQYIEKLHLLVNDKLLIIKELVMSSDNQVNEFSVTSNYMFCDCLVNRLGTDYMSNKVHCLLLKNYKEDCPILLVCIFFFSFLPIIGFSDIGSIYDVICIILSILLDILCIFLYFNLKNMYIKLENDSLKCKSFFQSERVYHYNEIQKCIFEKYYNFPKLVIVLKSGKKIKVIASNLFDDLIHEEMNYIAEKYGVCIVYK